MPTLLESPDVAAAEPRQAVAPINTVPAARAGGDPPSALALFTELQQAVAASTVAWDALPARLAALLDVPLLAIARSGADASVPDFSAWHGESGLALSDQDVATVLSRVWGSLAGTVAAAPGAQTGAGPWRDLLPGDGGTLLRYAYLAGPRADGAVDLLLLGQTGDGPPGPAQWELLRALHGLVTLALDRDEARAGRVRDHPQVLRAKREWELSVDELSQLVCLVDGDGRVLRANRALERMGLGSVNQVAGTPLVGLLAALGPWADGRGPARGGAAAASGSLEQRWARAWAEWWQGRGAPPGESELLHAQDGRVYSLRLSRCGAGIEIGGARPDCCVAVVDDVTDQVAARRVLKSHSKELEVQVARQTQALRRLNRALEREAEAHRADQAALALSEAKYQSLVDNSLVGIFLLERGCITYCNRRLADMMGCSRAQVVGLRPVELFGASARQQGEPSRDGHVLFTRRRDGSGAWLRLLQAPVADDAADPVIGNVIDITERMQYELRLVAEQRRSRKLSDQLLEAQEAERRRLARELHDGVGQRLSVLQLRLDQFAMECPTARADVLADMTRGMRGVIGELRQVSMNLRPPMLDDLGLEAALSWFLREFRAAARDLEVSADLPDHDWNYPADLSTQLFRITQEAFTNVVKHAGARRIAYRLARDAGGLLLRVADDGVGLPDQGDCEWSGVGLGSMAERAELSGGRLVVLSRFSSGTVVSARWPASVLVS